MSMCRNDQPFILYVYNHRSWCHSRAGIDDEKQADIPPSVGDQPGVGDVFEESEELVTRVFGAGLAYGILHAAEFERIHDPQMITRRPPGPDT